MILVTQCSGYCSLLLWPSTSKCGSWISELVLWAVEDTYKYGRRLTDRDMSTNVSTLGPFLLTEGGGMQNVVLSFVIQDMKSQRIHSVHLSMLGNCKSVVAMLSYQILIIWRGKKFNLPGDFTSSWESCYWLECEVSELGGKLSGRELLFYICERHEVALLSYPPRNLQTRVRLPVLES